MARGGRKWKKFIHVLKISIIKKATIFPKRKESIILSLKWRSVKDEIEPIT
jgi:hypothetical protein